ncbi:MAG: hypothetical protein K6E37_06365 [Bacteroidales bacterium]|nr:hypothetical protein [Bacteroidales bacterium]
MKRFVCFIIALAATASVCSSCLSGLLSNSSVKSEISGDLWVIDSYRMRINGVYDQTTGYDIWGMVVDGDWTPGSEITVQYIRFPDAEESLSLKLLGKTEDVSISTSGSVLFMYSHIGGPYSVEYKKGSGEVTLHMDYSVQGVAHNDFIKMKKTKSVSKGQKISVK